MGKREADRDRYYEEHARATGRGGGLPSAERLNKASPADTGYGKRVRPFAPGPIPDITKELTGDAPPRKKVLMKTGRSMAGGGR